jgi:hypothetical protein
MRDIALNLKNWDLQIQNGDLLLIEDDLERLQYFKIRCQTFLGEWLTDKDFGIDWLGILPRKPEAIHLASSEVLAVADEMFPGKVEMIRSDWSPSNRKLEVELKIQGQFIGISPLLGGEVAPLSGWIIDFENW